MIRDTHLRTARWLALLVAALGLGLSACGSTRADPAPTAVGVSGGGVTVSERPAVPGREQATVRIGRPTIFVTPTSSRSLQRAVESARPGSIIHLASGTYPKLIDSKARRDWVTITGTGDATPPTINGAMLWGSQYLRFIGVTFSSSVYLSYSPTKRYAQIAKDFALINSQIDCHADGALNGGALQGHTGIAVRGGTRGVTLEGDYVHNCTVGLSTIASDKVSTDLTIAHSTFYGFSGDAVHLGGLQNVVIHDDIIGGAVHSGPERLFHDDGIQFLGNTANVQITDNVLRNSDGQLLFIQDAIKSRYTGSSINRDILVENNLIYGANAYAVQDQGGIDVRFINNTMWNNHLGSLLIRKSGFTGIVPTNTVVLNNIIEGMGFDHVIPMLVAHNLIDGYISPKVRRLPRRGNRLRVNPRFVDAAAGDFQLAARSPALHDGASATMVRRYSGIEVPGFGPGAPPTTVSIGALQPGTAVGPFGPPTVMSEYLSSPF